MWDIALGIVVGGLILGVIALVGMVVLAALAQSINDKL